MPTAEPGPSDGPPPAVLRREPRAVSTAPAAPVAGTAGGGKGVRQPCEVADERAGTVSVVPSENVTVCSVPA
ncbi:hypothetical protein SUDANB171_00087 [Streptomyces sp. enrichment culture]